MPKQTHPHTLFLSLLMQCTGRQLGCLLHLAITRRLGFRDVAILLQHGCRCWRYDPQTIPNSRLQRVVPVVIWHWNHSRWELFRCYFRVASGQGRYNPDVSESGEAQRASLLQDVEGLILRAVEQDHWWLDLLQHDLRPAVFLHCVQSDDILQVPAHKTKARITRTGVKC